MVELLYLELLQFRNYSCSEVMLTPKRVKITPFEDWSYFNPKFGVTTVGGVIVNLKF